MNKCWVCKEKLKTSRDRDAGECQDGGCAGLTVDEYNNLSEEQKNKLRGN